MTNREAAMIASRIFCVWFIYQAILDLWAIPSIVFALMQGSILSGVNPSVAARVERTLMVSSLTDLFRFAANTVAAIFFYRCSARLIRFLTGAETDFEPNEAEAAL
jgi:hypothetical protein